jgi:predicted HTH domain antitoxin
VYNVNMAVGTISMRLPEQVRHEVEQFEKDEKLTQISEAARKLLLIGLESWKKEKALKLLEQGKISFSRAAAIAGLDVWSFADLVKEQKIVWIKDKEMIQQDIEAAQ